MNNFKEQAEKLLPTINPYASGMGNVVDYNKGICFARPIVEGLLERIAERERTPYNFELEQENKELRDRTDRGLPERCEHYAIKKYCVKCSPNKNNTKLQKPVSVEDIENLINSNVIPMTIRSKDECYVNTAKLAQAIHKLINQQKG